MAAFMHERDHDEPLLESERDSLDIDLSELDQLQHDSSETKLSYTPQHVRSMLSVSSVLLLTVVGFTINTEATAYFEDVLGWKKPFATMYVTHSSLLLPWLCHFVYDRFRHRHQSHTAWFGGYISTLRSSIHDIDAFTSFGSFLTRWKISFVKPAPLEYLATTMALTTVVLTVSGCSWFFALVLTTPGDLTAIYNCATFFAAVFSVPILHEPLGRWSMAAVVLSLVGTFVIAYGDTTAEHPVSAAEAEGGSDAIGSARLLGNLIACVGAVAFGLYEVVFKKWACATRPSVGPSSSLSLTLAATGLLGAFTMATLWIPLLALHILDIEPFVWPSADVVFWLVIAVLSGAGSIASLMVLVVWTSPIFGSMANVLSVFLVALADWMVFGLEPSAATYIGGIIIIVAFLGLAADTFVGQKG